MYAYMHVCVCVCMARYVHSTVLYLSLTNNLAYIIAYNHNMYMIWSWDQEKGELLARNNMCTYTGTDMMQKCVINYISYIKGLRQLRCCTVTHTMITMICLNVLH